ncbi:hypothetical protein CEXT_179921 [Caerostris extrusa]|uniref:Uncharacterized protein n=1 Tax=Caerostris extrusa TaxID=172846 RepID=A0AAV4PQ61_CAEEX|nr:hypothetical protein CEXT_179921 [Caerostris extrusa]
MFAKAWNEIDYRPDVVGNQVGFNCYKPCNNEPSCKAGGCGERESEDDEAESETARLMSSSVVRVMRPRNLKNIASTSPLPTVPRTPANRIHTH